MNEKETIPRIRIGLLNSDGTVISTRYKVDEECLSGPLSITQLKTATCLKKMFKDWNSFMLFGDELKIDPSEHDFLYENKDEYCMLLFDGKKWTVHINHGSDYVSIYL